MAGSHRNVVGILLFSLLALSSCARSEIANTPPPTPIFSQANTIDLENSDRVARFERLAQTDGIVPPTVEQVFAPAGAVPGVPGRAPVVRVVFPEGVFFNTNSATPLPQALVVVKLIAQNMQRDVPDAALTILGHTDSTGTDAYNMRLSERRALAVMAMLAAHGVDPIQMTTVAIGDHQPIAPNDTPEGRAINRRVEFLISASPEANLAVVQKRDVTLAYLSTGGAESAPASTFAGSVPVFQGQGVNLHGERTVTAVSIGPLEIAPPTKRLAAAVTSKPLAPPPTVTMRPATPVAPAQLSNIVVK